MMLLFIRLVQKTGSVKPRILCCTQGGHRGYRLQEAQEATRNVVLANKLAALPAMQDALLRHGTLAKSACGLLTNDNSPRKENPRLRMTRLIPAEILCRRL